MILATSAEIAAIDTYCEKTLGIPTRDLMKRAGIAVANAVKSNIKEGASVVIFAGKGNNGGDGYAAAIELMRYCSVTVFDVFGEGQRSEAGKHFLTSFKRRRGVLRPLRLDGDDIELIRSTDCIVDAIFGTGFKGDIPEKVGRLAEILNELVGVYKIAVDVPIGVNADDGSVDIAKACAMTETVSLAFVKPGLVSYPGKSYVGKLTADDLGIPQDKLQSYFMFENHLVDRDVSVKMLPKRPKNSNKGTFGKLLSITGSQMYRGAAQLSVEASLRGGAGLVTYLGEECVVNQLSQSFPEAIYKRILPFDSLSDDDIDEIVELSKKHTATLIGSGSGHTEGLYKLVSALLKSSGSTLILDADAINVLTDNRDAGIALLKESKREIVITPHPLEFSRLTGIPVSDVQMNRIASARKAAEELSCTVVLKGAGTVITNGKSVYINSTGSSALAKAGSGDVLAGFIASLIASGADSLNASIVGVYFHGKASDVLVAELSELGVTPSDLPRKIAKCVAEAQKM